VEEGRHHGLSQGTVTVGEGSTWRSRIIVIAVGVVCVLLFLRIRIPVRSTSAGIVLLALITRFAMGSEEFLVLAMFLGTRDEVTNDLGIYTMSARHR
jgi:hypothetical protein